MRLIHDGRDDGIVYNRFDCGGDVWVDDEIRIAVDNVIEYAFGIDLHCVLASESRIGSETDRRDGMWTDPVMAVAAVKTKFLHGEDEVLSGFDE